MYWERLFIASSFYAILLGVAYLFTAKFLNPEPQRLAQFIDQALIAQCRAYDDNPWVAQVGWDAPIPSGENCPDTLPTIGRPKELQTRHLTEVLRRLADNPSRLTAAERSAQRVRFRLAAQLAAVRSELSRAQDALFCLHKSGRGDPSLQQEYREYVARLLLNQCAVSRQIADIWDFNRHVLPARRRELLWSISHERRYAADYSRSTGSQEVPFLFAAWY